METMRSTCRRSRGRELLRPRLTAQLIFIVLICAPPLSGVYLYVSAKCIISCKYSQHT